MLAIDYGERHIGLAVQTIAGPMPLDPVDIKKTNWNSHLKSVVSQYRIKEIVVGCSSGNADLAVKVKTFCEAVKNVTGLPVIVVDESMTSIWAEDVLRSFALPKRAIKTKSHSVAAAKLLAGYLEGQKRGVIAFK